MGSLVGRLTAAACVLLVAPLLTSPAHAADVEVAPSSLSPSCVQGSATNAVAQVTGRVVNQGAGVSAARIYAYNLESGTVTCVVTASDGTYTAPLPGIVEGSGLRRSAEGWIVAAATPVGSNLGGTSRALAWNAVARDGTIAIPDLALGEATVAGRGTIEGGLVAAPTLVCAGFDTSQWGGPCGIAPASSSDPVLLATGNPGPQTIYAQARVDGAWWEVWDTTGVAGTTSTVPLQMEPQAANQQCSEGQPVRGTVRRTVDGVDVGADSYVVAYATWMAGGVPQRVYVGDAVSDRSGAYLLCATSTYLPPAGTPGLQGILAASSEMGGVTTVSALAPNCATGCTGEDVLLETSPDLGGTVTFAGASGLDASAAFASWSIFAGSIVNGNPTYSFDVAGGMSGPDGAWGLAFVDGLDPVPDGSYLANVRPASAQGGFVEAYQAFTSADSSASVNVTLEQGNFVGRVLGADRSPIGWNWLGLSQVECSSECIGRGTSTDSQGFFAVDLPDGTFEVTAYADWGNSNSVTTTRQITVANGVVTSFAGSAPSDPLVFVLDGPNARILVRSAGTAVPGVGIEVMKWKPEGWTQGVAAGYTSSSGIAGLRLAAGDYIAQIDHWGSELVPGTFQHWRVTQSGSDVTISTCQIEGRVLQQPCPSGAVTTPLPKNAEGDWILDLPTPNLVVTVQSPDGSTSLPEASACLIHEGSTAEGSWSENIDCSSANSAGKVAFALPSSGSYTVRVHPPWDTDEDWVENSYRFQTDATGSVCSVTSTSSCTPLASPEVSLPLAGPNIIASVTGAGGAELAGGWVQVQRACSYHDECREWIAHAYVSQRGRFALKLPSGDDTYYLRVEPWFINDGSIATTFAIRVPDASVTQSLSLQLKMPNVTGTVVDSASSALANVSIGVERSLGDGQWRWVNAWASTSLTGDYRLLLDPGTYRLRLQPQSEDRSRAVTTTSASFTLGATAVDVDVTMRAPNLTGTLKSPDGVSLPYAWIEVQKWFPAYGYSDGGYYSWSDEVPGSDTSVAGRFSVNLPQGRWRLVANPPWGTLSASQTIVPVVSDGTGVCLDTVPETPCNAGRYLASSYQLVMGRPNASGQVLMPDGVGEIPYAWIEVQKWFADAGEFSWDFDLPAASTGPRASFALKLPSGRWRLTAHPGFTLLEATRNSVDVTVDGFGLCLTVNAPCSIDDSIGVGELDILLRTPNIVGTVTAGGAGVPNTWVNAERWISPGDYWQWTRSEAWTRDGGRYAMALIDDGIYRIQAGRGSGVRGFVEGYSYVRVASDQVCEIGSAPQGSAVPPCVPGTVLDDTIALQTALTPANFVAVVRGDAAPVPWTWIQLQRREASGWSYDQGASTLADGSVSLLVSTDDTTLYRLRIEPPWGSNANYVRTNVEFIAYRDGAQTRTCAVSAWNSAGRTCTQPISSNAPMQAQLNTGGLQGRVTSPDGATPVSWSWVEVQQWTEFPWSPGSYGWQWIDASAYSRANGIFTLSLEEPGIYRLTARPSGTNLLGWSRRTTIVQFDGAGAWCRQDPISGSGPASAYGACEDPSVMSAQRLEMPLISSNVVGAVLFDEIVNGVATARAMPYGWVDIRRENGSWVTSLETSSQGRFAVFLEDDTYDITAYPNWRFSQKPPLMKRIVVRNGVVVSGLTNGELLLNLDAVPPNVFLSVTGVTGARLIAVERDADGDGATADWQLEPRLSSTTDGLSPNAAGFSLPPGLYRLTVVPEIGRIRQQGGQVLVTVPATGTVSETVNVIEAAAPAQTGGP